MRLVDYQLFYASNVDYLYGDYIHDPRNGCVSSFRDCKLFEYTNESGGFYPGEKTFTIKAIYNGSYDKNLHFNSMLGLASRREMGSLNYTIINRNAGGSYSTIETWHLYCKLIGVTQIDSEDNGVYSLELKFYAPNILWFKLIDTVEVRSNLGGEAGFKGEGATGYSSQYNVPGIQKMIGLGWKINDVSNNTTFRIYERYLDPEALATLSSRLTVKSPYYPNYNVDVEIDYPNKTINEYAAISNYTNPFIEVPMAYWTIDAPESTERNFSTATMYVYELRGMPPWK